jgi:hypothetical protein
LVNLSSDETMRLTMDRRRGIGVGSLNKAKDLSALPVHPVAQIADVVASLSLQVSLMSFAHILKAHCAIEAVDIRIERHGSSFGRKFENDRRSA